MAETAHQGTDRGTASRLRGILLQQSYIECLMLRACYQSRLLNQIFVSA
jgi:hypothetical protein